MGTGALVHTWQKINVEGFQVSVSVIVWEFWGGFIGMGFLFGWFLFVFYPSTMMLMFKC